MILILNYQPFRYLRKQSNSLWREPHLSCQSKDIDISIDDAPCLVPLGYSVGQVDAPKLRGRVENLLSPHHNRNSNARETYNMTIMKTSRKLAHTMLIDGIRDPNTSLEFLDDLVADALHAGVSKTTIGNLIASKNIDPSQKTRRPIDNILHFTGDEPMNNRRGPIGSHMSVQGDFTPRTPSSSPYDRPVGKDNIPAWLTSGEYVLNKEATDLFGPQIHAMNEAGLDVREGIPPQMSPVPPMGQQIDEIEIERVDEYGRKERVKMKASNPPPPPPQQQSVPLKLNNGGEASGFYLDANKRQMHPPALNDGGTVPAYYGLGDLVSSITSLFGGNQTVPQQDIQVPDQYPAFDLTPARKGSDEDLINTSSQSIEMTEHNLLNDLARSQQYDREAANASSEVPYGGGELFPLNTQQFSSDIPYTENPQVPDEAVSTPYDREAANASSEVPYGGGELFPLNTQRFSSDIPYTDSPVLTSPENLSSEVPYGGGAPIPENPQKYNTDVANPVDIYSKPFDGYFENLLISEGGFSDNSVDRGGPTNLGITLPTLQRSMPDATVEDLRNLTPELAKAIYRDDYYTSPNIDKLSEHIREQVFDMSVNHGAPQAIKLLQRSLKIPESGVVDKRTIDASHNADNNTLADTRQAYYDNIIANDETQKEFSRGWKARTDKFRDKTGLEKLVGRKEGFNQTGTEPSSPSWIFSPKEGFDTRPATAKPTADTPKAEEIISYIGEDDNTPGPPLATQATRNPDGGWTAVGGKITGTRDEAIAEEKFLMDNNATYDPNTGNYISGNWVIDENGKRVSNIGKAEEETKNVLNTVNGGNKQETKDELKWVKDTFSDIFKDMFGGDVKRAVLQGLVLYAGSRALGYDGTTSLRYASRQLQARGDQVRSERKAEEKLYTDRITANPNYYTNESIEKFLQSKDPSELKQRNGYTPYVAGDITVENGQYVDTSTGEPVRGEDNKPLAVAEGIADGTTIPAQGHGGAQVASTQGLTLKPGGTSVMFLEGKPVVISTYTDKGRLSASTDDVDYKIVDYNGQKYHLGDFQTMLANNGAALTTTAPTRIDQVDEIQKAAAKASAGFKTYFDGAKESELTKSGSVVRQGWQPQITPEAAQLDLFTFMMDEGYDPTDKKQYNEFQKIANQSYQNYVQWAKYNKGVPATFTRFLKDNLTKTYASGSGAQNLLPQGDSYAARGTRSKIYDKIVEGADALKATEGFDKLSTQERRKRLLSTYKQGWSGLSKEKKAYFNNIALEQGDGTNGFSVYVLSSQ